MASNRQRTIQYPGVEFWETTNFNTASTNTGTVALAVGYFPKGPIAQPVSVSNISEFNNLFGKPETDAEYYAYRGISNILNVGKSVTVIRFPYDNSLSPLDYDAIRRQINPCIDQHFRVLKGKFNLAKNSTGKYADIAAAFTEDVQFKTISLEPDFISQNALTDYASGFSQDTSEFIIANKYHDSLDANDSEYIVSLYGIANAIRAQSLAADTVNADSIQYYGSKALYEEDNKLLFSRNEALWQYDNVSLNNYFDELVKYYPAITTLDAFSINEKGLPKREISFKSFSKPEAPGQYVLTEFLYDRSLYPDEPPADYQTATINFITSYNASGTDVSDIIAGLPREFPLDNFKLSVEEDGAIELYRLDENGIKTESYLVTVADNTTGDIDAFYYPYRWTFYKAATFDKQPGIYAKLDDQLLVVVSRLKRSNIESDKFILEPVEVFAGSLSQSARSDSNYLPDIINNYSKTISFYTSKKSPGLAKTDAILVEQQVPYRLSLVDESPYSLTRDTKINLKKTIKTKANEAIDMANVLGCLLKLVQNNTSFTYTDVYDFGLSSILSQLSLSTDGYYYEKRYANSNIMQWKSIARRLISHCQNNHKLSMAFIDGPRSLLLTGDLSKAYDYNIDQETAIITGRACQQLAIKDSTYGAVNIQWVEDVKENNERVWLPASTYIAANITSNDIIHARWNAPAGYNYGRIRNAFRLALNPTAKVKTNLYTNCLNYASAWASGSFTLEGQKTTCIENVALNRINVRRLMIYLERYVQTVAGHYLYQNNTDELRAELSYRLSNFFDSIVSNGGLYDYKLVCDNSNNSPDVIDKNELRLSIAVQPARTVEFIVAEFILDNSGITIRE